MNELKTNMNIYILGRSMIQCLDLQSSFWKNSLSRELETTKKEVLWYFQILMNDRFIAGRQNHRVSSSKT